MSGQTVPKATRVEKASEESTRYTDMPEHGNAPKVNAKFWQPAIKSRPTHKRYAPYPHFPTPIVQPKAPATSTSTEALMKPGMVAPPLGVRPPLYPATPELMGFLQPPFMGP
eukprot:10288016-Lingulodinium_polyedra.AAC.1